METVLHIGTHKTGTTLLQRAAKRNREDLLAQGVFYPDYDLINKPRSNAHHAVAHAIAGYREELSEDDVCCLISRAREAARDCGTVLFSAEAFCRHKSLSSDAFNEGYWEAHERYISKVRKLFSGHVRVVVVLRRQDVFAASLYQENVKKHNKITMTFREFLSEFDVHFDYCRELEIWESYFGCVDAYVYDDLCEGDGIVANFFEALGVDSSHWKVPSVANPSMPYDIVEFKRVMNNTPLSNEFRDTIRDALIEGVATGALAARNSREYWLSEEERRRFLSAYEAGNERVRGKFTKVSRDRLFPRNRLDDGVTEYGGLDGRKFKELFTKYVGVDF